MLSLARPEDQQRFQISTFANSLSFPTSMLSLEDGSLVVAINRGTSLFGSTSADLARLADNGNDGIADGDATIIASNLPGLVTSIRRLDDIIVVLSAKSGQETITLLRTGARQDEPLSKIGTLQLGFPEGFEHTTYAVALRRSPADDQTLELFFNIGAKNNSTPTGDTERVSMKGDNTTIHLDPVLLEADSIHRISLAASADGTFFTAKADLIARGLRNAAGMVFGAEGDLYLHDNGIDGSPRDNSLSADELNKISSQDIGRIIPDFGFPSNYIDSVTGATVTGLPGKIEPLQAFLPLGNQRSEGITELALPPQSFGTSFQSGIFAAFIGMVGRGGTNNKENPIVFSDLASGEYFHFAPSQLLGNPYGLTSTSDSLYISDISSTGNLGDNTKGVIYRISPIAITPEIEPISVESQGNTALLRRADGSPVVEVGGTRYNVSSPWGTPVGSPSSQWQMLAAETIGGSNQILFRNNTFNYLHTWTLNSHWNWTASFGTINPSSAQGWDLESSFHVDANNDGIIGAPISNVPATVGLLTKNLVLGESNAGLTPFSFTVQRSGNLSQASSLDWAIQGTGVNPTDRWDFRDDQFPEGTVVFAPGESTRTITVNVRGDTVVETDERFLLTLSNAAGASLNSQALTAEGLITNDDAGTWIYDWANAQPLGDTPGVLLATLTTDSFRPGEQPLKLQALRVDLSTPGLTLHSTTPISDWQADSRETLTQTTRGFLTSSRQEGVPVVAAINTAFFELTSAGQAVPTNLLGFAVSGGKLVSPTQGFHPFFVQDPITGARLVRNPASTPDPTSVGVAFAGMSNGVVLWDGLVTGVPEPDPILNARTGLGLSRDNRFLTMISVDRSVRSLSGPTYWGAGIRDVGSLLAGFGSYTGLNLDGGGSTQMAWWDPVSQSAQLLNAPLLGLERHVGSNLGIVYQQP